MTREEQLRFCKICENKKFDSARGIVCGLTNEPADFDGECPSFQSTSNHGSTYFSHSARLISNSANAKIAIIVFWAIAVFSFLAVLSGYLEYDLLVRIRDGFDYTDQEINLNDLRQGILGLVQAVISIGSIIIFLMWFGRAYANLHRINPRGLNHSKNMAIWSFMIPIINLFKPYHIAKEISEVTTRRVQEKDPEHSRPRIKGILGTWWALFLISNFAGRIAFRAILSAGDTVESYIDSTTAYMVSDLLNIPAAIITLVMIKTISREEKALYEHYG